MLTQYAMNTVLPTLAVLGLHEYDKLLIASYIIAAAKDLSAAKIDVNF